MGIYLLYIIPLVFIQTVYGGVEFNVDRDPISFREGELVSVVCSLSNDADVENAQLEWYDKTGLQITNTNPSTFPYVKNMIFPMNGKPMTIVYLGRSSEDVAGKYKCKATVDGAVVYENELTIENLALLKFTDCPEEQFGILGEESKITCTATGSGFVFSSWSRDAAMGPLEGDNYITGQTDLTIRKTEMSDGGMYDYTATQMEQSQTGIKNINFKVYTAPTIVQPILQTTAIVGRSAALFCKAKGIPDPEIEWRKEGSTNILVTTDRITVIQKKEGEDIQGILNFTSIIKEDQARYTCTAKNLASSKEGVDAAETEDELIVQIPPTIEQLKTVKGKEGGAANLVCIARGDPIPNMVWVKVKTGERFSAGTTSKDVSVIENKITVPGNLGANLTLAYTNLKHSDAGDYKCEAKNKADTTEAIVKLEVQYKPNFKDQGPTTFYNWFNNDEPYITCIANGNPRPTLRWYKGDRKITATDNFPVVVNEEDQQPYRAVSKLKVEFDGNNKDAVFGTYRCEAINDGGTSEISLIMEEAEKPPTGPSVTIHDEDAVHIEFWLDGPVVKGPDVTHYKVVYSVQGSPDKPKEHTVAKEYRDHIDTARKYTILTVVDLIPATFYTFNFYAINDVGMGPQKEMTKKTNSISEPDKPEIYTQSNSPKPTSILVQWHKPSDGGSQILEYKLTYERVDVKQNKSFDSTKGYEVLKKIRPEKTVTGIKETQFNIVDLLPGSYYLVHVSARNGKGWGNADRKVIRTQIAELAPGASSDPRYDADTSGGVSRWEPVKVSMTMFGCLVALCACLKRLM